MTKEGKVEVKVGRWSGGGTFLGEVVRFTAEEVGVHTEYAGEFSSGDDRGTDYTLYEAPGERYRVHVKHWSRHDGEGEAAYLYPNDFSDPEEDLEEGMPERVPDRFTTYTVQEARRKFGSVFAALGMPNTRDID